MIKLEKFEVMGWEHAIRGMRNPMNSWEKSDSGIGCTKRTDWNQKLDIGPLLCKDCGVTYDSHCICRSFHTPRKQFVVGDNDHKLMMKLRNAGTDHRKFMRMITVYVDITAPLYWWKDFDTYKVGTVANSCSTMHKIHDKELEWGDFSTEHLMYDRCGETEDSPLILNPADRQCALAPQDIMILTIDMLNASRLKYLETNDKKYWWQMIQLLPSSYNQKRTIMLNYEVLANIYRSRRNHKLDEWVEFCAWIEKLPYSEIITGREKILTPNETRVLMSEGATE